MRVLIVSYYFPPAAGGGVQRVLKLAKYLPEFGVEVHVLAPDDPGWMDRGGNDIPAGTTVHRARYLGPKPGRPREVLASKRGVDRLVARLMLVPRRLFLPDLHRPWAWTAVRAGTRVVRDHGIDVVISTSPPESDHVIGHRMSRRARVPWIADLRDSWLHEPGLRLDHPSVRLKRFLNTRIARRTIGRADRIVTVSQPIADELAREYPDRDVRVIMNGVDLQDLEGVPARAPDGQFTIVYTGNFFGRRSPRPFLAALDALLDRRPDIAERMVVRFLGTLRIVDEGWIGDRPRLADIVERQAFVEYREALAAQHRADLLLLIIAGGDERHRGEVTGKVFEYVAARRPLLAVVPSDGAAAALLDGYDAATIVTPNDTGGIETAIERTFDAWRSDGTRDAIPDDAMTARISRRERAREYAALVRELVDEA